MYAAKINIDSTGRFLAIMFKIIGANCNTPFNFDDRDIRFSLKYSYLSYL